MASGASHKARDFGGPNVWAGLRASDAGDAEEELGVQQNTSAVYPTGRVAKLPSLFELEDTQRSWIYAIRPTNSN